MRSKWLLVNVVDVCAADQQLDYQVDENWRGNVAVATRGRLHDRLVVVDCCLQVFVHVVPPIRDRHRLFLLLCVDAVLEVVGLKATRELPPQLLFSVFFRDTIGGQTVWDFTLSLCLLLLRFVGTAVALFKEVAAVLVTPNFVLCAFTVLK